MPKSSHNHDETKSICTIECPAVPRNIKEVFAPHLLDTSTILDNPQLSGYDKFKQMGNLLRQRQAAKQQKSA